jgi:ribosomal protein S18 acetylase RimI-like enzyme
VLVRPVAVPLRDDGGDAAGTDEGTAAAQPGPAGRGPGEPVITFAEEPDDDWLRGWLAVKAGGGVDLDLARRVVAGAAARYATASDEHGVVGVIRAAPAGEWVGLSCLMVAERGRRRGLGRRLTELALRDAADRGATRAFLQVEEHNVGARALYLGAGFQTAEVYEYCERPTAPGTAPTGGC